MVLRQKRSELNAITFDYDSGVEKNKRLFCKNQKLAEELMKLKKKIEVICDDI